jgi:hypothetical protein
MSPSGWKEHLAGTAPELVVGDRAQRLDPAIPAVTAVVAVSVATAVAVSTVVGTGTSVGRIICGLAHVVDSVRVTGGIVAHSR